MPRTATLAFESNEQPTGRLPAVTLFDLIAEARRMDGLAEASDDERTVNIDPEEHRRLLASALVVDEPSLQLSVERPTAAPAAVAMSVSAIQARVRPELARGPRGDRGNAWLPKGTTETWIVAGIWVTALSLMAILTLIVTAT